MSAGIRSVENIWPGDYIAILGFKLEWPTSPWQPLCPAFDGRPLKVLAVCHPFVAVQDIQASRYALDFRAYELTKVDNKYAEAFPWARSGIQPQPVWTDQTDEQRAAVGQSFWDGLSPRKLEPVTSNPAIERPDTEVVGCPRCGARMSQRLFSRPEPGWRRWCSVCGFDLGPIEGEPPPQEQGAKE